jgi:phage terminase small subunit
MPEGEPPHRKRRQVRSSFLTPKEIKFLKHYVKTGNQSESALAAGSVSAHPEVVGSMLMKKLREKCPEIILRIGLHQERVFKKVLIPGLEAMKTELVSFNGVFTDSKELVDHEQRGKYLDRYCKLLGLYGNGFDGNSDSPGRSPVTVNLVIADPRVAEAIAHRLAGGQGGDEQSALDVSLDEYEGRPRSAEPV